MIDLLDDDDQDYFPMTNKEILKEPSDISIIPTYYKNANRRTWRLYPNKYFILAHLEQPIHTDFLQPNIKRITEKGQIGKDEDGNPILKNLCDNRLEEDITENYTVSTRDDTVQYDGVYLCKDGIAIRIMKFENQNITKKLSSIVYLISHYDYSVFKNPNSVYTVGVLDSDNITMVGGKSKRKRTRRKRARKKANSYRRR